MSPTEVSKAKNAACHFTYEEIERATNNFSEVIGRGGFGIVYKGRLEDGKDVAVKVSAHASHPGPEQFLNEVLYNKFIIWSVKFAENDGH